MASVLAGRSIERVRIIDDDPGARQVYGYSVEDLDLEPIAAKGPFSDLKSLVEETQDVAEAAICDFKLRVRNYASFDGAEFVAMLYKSKFPAVLCTRWEVAGIDEIREHRRYIPVLLKPDELEPETLVSGLERCIQEFNGGFQPSRRPWRTLVRVEEVDEERSNFYVIVPGWDPHDVVRLRLEDPPPEIQERIRRGQERFHAQVNIGAEANEDLYFEEWEID